MKDIWCNGRYLMQGNYLKQRKIFEATEDIWSNVRYLKQLRIFEAMEDI